MVLNVPSAGSCLLNRSLFEDFLRCLELPKDVTLLALRPPPRIRHRHLRNRLDPGDEVARIFAGANGLPAAIDVNRAGLCKRVEIVYRTDKVPR